MKRGFSSIAHQVLKQQNYNKLPSDGRSHKKTKPLGCRQKTTAPRKLSKKPPERPRNVFED
jgi:hypothetical protein